MEDANRQSFNDETVAGSRPSAAVEENLAQSLVAAAQERKSCASLAVGVDTPLDVHASLGACLALGGIPYAVEASVEEGIAFAEAVVVASVAGQRVP